MVSDGHGQAAAPVTRLQPRVAWLRRACLVAALIAGRRSTDPGDTGGRLARDGPVRHRAWLPPPSPSGSSWSGVGPSKGSEMRSVLVVSAGIYVIEVVGLVVVPESIPILALATLVPLVVRCAIPGPTAAVTRLRRRRRHDHRLRRGGGGRPDCESGCRDRRPLRARRTRRGGRHPARPVPARAVQPDGQRPARRGPPRRPDRPAQPDPLHRPSRARHGALAAQVGGGRSACPPTTAVVYLDIDGFKDINDRHGHGHGDAVLRAVADRLRQTARAADTVARIGGDEFAILVEDVADRADVVALRSGSWSRWPTPSPSLRAPSPCG